MNLNQLREFNRFKLTYISSVNEYEKKIIEKLPRKWAKQIFSFFGINLSPVHFYSNKSPFFIAIDICQYLNFNSHPFNIWMLQWMNDNFADQLKTETVEEFGQ